MRKTRFFANDVKIYYVPHICELFENNKYLLNLHKVLIYRHLPKMHFFANVFACFVLIL